MSSHHHSCCCCCRSSSSSCSIPPPLQPASTCTSNADDLLQLLAANLLLQNPPPSSSAHFLHPYLNPYPYPCPYPYRPEDDQISDERQLRRQQHHQVESTLHSLARRAAALDSTFLSSPPPPSPDKKHHKRPPPPPNPTHQTSAPPQTPVVRSPSSSRISLRDLAARTIQAAFRRHLVRRSQTLRHLKDLAVVKSHTAALRSAVSDEKCRDPEALWERAENLLLRLDAIQSGDPMIREGKRSINKDLSRILDFIDKVLLKEHRLPPEAEQVEEANVDGGRALLEDSRKRAKSKKGSAKNPTRKVKFFEETKRSEASFVRHEPAICDSSGTVHENGLVGGIIREVTGVGASRDLTESNGCYQVSDYDETSNDSPLERTEGKHGKGRHFQLQNSELGLAAPIPAQMEARTG